MIETLNPSIIHKTEVIEVDTREGYDQWSATYDSTGNPLVAMEERAISVILGDIRGLSAIDLGCGTGRNSRKLHALGATVTGIDFSEGMLNKAIDLSRGLDISYQQHDLSQPLPFGDQSFDLVICSLVIEHLAELTPVFTEMGRICRKDGVIIVSDLHPAMRLRDAQAQFTDAKRGRDIRPKGFPHSMSEYVLSIRDAGLKLLDMKEYVGLEEMVPTVPKMKRYVDWPMLVIFKMRSGGHSLSEDYRHPI